MIDTLEQQNQLIVDYVAETWKKTSIGASEPQYKDNIFSTNVIEKTTMTPRGEEIHYSYNFSLGPQLISFHQTTLYEEVVVESSVLDLDVCTELVPITKQWIEITDQVSNKKTRYNLMKSASCNIVNETNYEEVDPFDLPF